MLVSIKDETRRDRLAVSDGFILRTEDPGDCYFSKPHMFIDLFEKKKSRFVFMLSRGS